MKKNIFIITIILICTLIFNQCKPDKGKLLGTYKFTTEDLKIVPYNGGETIILIDSLGDTIKFSNLTRESKFYNYYIPEWDKNEYNDYYYLEKNETYTYANNVYLVIKLNFTKASTNIYSAPIYKKIDFDFRFYSHPDLDVFIEGFTFNGTNITDSGSHYYDSLIIRNKVFYSVYILDNSLDGHDTTRDFINEIYYSVNKGFIGFKTGQNKIWSLNN